MSKKEANHCDQAHTKQHEHSHNHSHNHDHEHSLFHTHVATNNKAALAIALIITSSIMILEFLGGIFTGSLALLSDSGHMLSDTISLVISLAAITFASRAATKKYHFGSQRYEILAALFNAITLFVIAGFIIFEAIERIKEPSTVASQAMIAIASIGLIANLLSMYVLTKKGDVEGSINLKSAYLHVLGDALGSVGAIIAGIIMLLTNWYYADPIISVIVAVIILKGAWRVLKQAWHILMEGAPAHISVAEVTSLLKSFEGVIDVNELHIWTITSDEHVLTVHLHCASTVNQQQLLLQVKTLLQQIFNLNRITIQIEIEH